MTRRYSIDIGEKLDNLLTDLAKAQDSSRAEIIRRAVAYYAFLSKEAAQGRKISVTDEEGRSRELVILP